MLLANKSDGMLHLSFIKCSKCGVLPAERRCLLRRQLPVHTITRSGAASSGCESKLSPAAVTQLMQNSRDVNQAALVVTMTVLDDLSEGSTICHQKQMNKEVPTQNNRGYFFGIRHCREAIE